MKNEKVPALQNWRTARAPKQNSSGTKVEVVA